MFDVLWRVWRSAQYLAHLLPWVMQALGGHVCIYLCTHINASNGRPPNPKNTDRNEENISFFLFLPVICIRCVVLLCLHFECISHVFRFWRNSVCGSVVLSHIIAVACVEWTFYFHFVLFCFISDKIATNWNTLSVLKWSQMCILLGILFTHATVTFVFNWTHTHNSQTHTHICTEKIFRWINFRMRRCSKID